MADDGRQGLYIHAILQGHSGEGVAQVMEVNGGQLRVEEVRPYRVLLHQLHDFSKLRLAEDFLRLEGFKELECLLEALLLDDNNAVFDLCYRLCTAYEKNAFRDSLLYGAHLMQELFTNE